MSPLQGSVKAPCPAPFHPSSPPVSGTCWETLGCHKALSPPVLCASLRHLCQAGEVQLWHRNETGDNVCLCSSCTHNSPNSPLLPWALLCTPGLCFPAFYLNHRSGHDSHAPKLWFTAHKRDGEHWTCKEEICYLLHLPKQLPAERPWLLGVPSYLCTPDKSCAFYAASRSWMSVWSC